MLQKSYFHLILFYKTTSVAMEIPQNKPYYFIGNEVNKVVFVVVDGGY